MEFLAQLKKLLKEDCCNLKINKKMKTLKYTNANKAIDVEYLTDLIGSNKTLTVYQITQFVNGVEHVGLNGTAATFGMKDTVDLFSLKQMTDQATDKNLTLEVYESGQNKVTLNTLTALNITTDNITAGVCGNARVETITIPATAAAAQGDYVVIKNALSQKTAAVWLDLNANGTAPTGVKYTGADYKIKVSIVTGGTAAQNATLFKNALAAVTAFAGELTLTDNGDGTVSLVQKYTGVVTASDPENTGSTGAGSIGVAQVTAGTAGTAYSLTFAAEGGNEAYTWTTASTLPVGLTLSTAGVLSGTPRELFNANVTVKVTDMFGVEDTFTDNLTVTAS